jgi:CubicO group peptidase (beta-lactamase class C family)
MKKIIAFVIVSMLFFLTTTTVFGNSKLDNYLLINQNEIDEFIINEMQINHIPGLSAAIVIDDTVVWKNTYGYANLEVNKKLENETLFKIASVSKTVTATALMQLYEQDYFELDDPINDYLPFDVIHPMHQTKDITFHNLLTHSSGIADNWDYLFHYVGDAPIPFQVFLEEYLVPGGDYYDEINNFHHWEPGTSWAYTNIGVALAGFLVEIISQENFTNYCQNHLFDLLDMNESGWYLRDLNVSNIAMPYHWNGEENIPYGHIGWVDVPAGDLRTSPSQLINFLTMFINNGIYKSKEILKSETVDLMLSPQLSFNENLGLIWWKSNIGGRTVWGHGGADYGARAQMHFEPETRIGVVLFINGESSILHIVNKLFDYAETLLENLPPETPDITGPNKGKADIEYAFYFISEDPDGDEIYYYINWGDGSIEEWIGPYPSGFEINLNHSWSEDGKYFIKSKVKDDLDQESSWKTIVIDIPRFRIKCNIFLYNIFNKFPILIKLFGH